MKQLLLCFCNICWNVAFLGYNWRLNCSPWRPSNWMFMVYSVCLYYIFKSSFLLCYCEHFLCKCTHFSVGNYFVFCIGVHYRSCIINSLIPKKCFYVMSVSFHLDLQTSLLPNLKYLNRAWFARWELHLASMHSAGSGGHSFRSWYSGLLKVQLPIKTNWGRSVQ